MGEALNDRRVKRATIISVVLRSFTIKINDAHISDKVLTKTQLLTLSLYRSLLQSLGYSQAVLCRVTSWSCRGHLWFSNRRDIRARYMGVCDQTNLRTTLLNRSTITMS